MATITVVSKKKVIRFVIIMIIILILLLVLAIFAWYKLSISKVSNDDKIISFEVEENDTYLSLGSKLKEQNLIKNVLAYKIYLKMNKVKKLNIGNYPLKKNMNIKTIIETLEKGPDENLTNIKITFPEGINMRRFVGLIEKNTKYKQTDVYSLLENTAFLDRIINKYWFITNKIKNNDIYYSLEGYLFPDTYTFKKDASLEKIIMDILDNTNKKITPYKDKIIKSKYDVHDTLTLASIVELEAATSSDRKKVAGVFYNRLNRGMGLESDVTTYYGLKKELTDSISGHVYDKNPYNTRNSSLAGKLPIGPISNPSLSSIEAVIDYEKVDYLYFVADTDKKVYFTKTYLEHQKIIEELKGKNKWNA